MTNPAARPALDDFELSLVQQIDVEERQVLIHHDVPGHDGKVIQRLNRDGTRVVIQGVEVGDDARVKLEELRGRF